MKIYYLFNLLSALINLIFLKKFLHIYQLKNYNNARYLKHFKNKSSKFFVLCLIVFIVELIFHNLILYTTLNLLLIICFLLYVKNLIKTSKIPLIFTGKLSRLYIFSNFILLLLCFYKHSFPLIFIFSLLCPILANAINIYDKVKNKIYINKAKKKLQNHPAQIIAITGSNGKTSVKNILQKILETEHQTQSTPASFNTPIGIAKFINNELKYNTEFLILEYGARHKNDIKELCKLFGADYGIVTTISAQHLESFKSIENIYKAKKQLANFLQNKPCVFNVDNLYTKRMYNEKIFNNYSASINTKADVFISNTQQNSENTSFDITIKNHTYSSSTILLGKHNLLNICLAATMADIIGISHENIIGAIKNLQPIEHRLQFIKSHINIIDDSYNCSPLSAQEALQTIKNFSGKKMIVTPGIIECGKEKYNINFNLGKQMSFCDFCVIVGHENKSAISNGIKSAILANKHSPQILYANTLEDAKQHFSKLHNNDTLLLLNDLPDDYK